MITIVMVYNNFPSTHTHMKQTQIVLDSCVVIGLFEGRVSSQLKKCFKGKSISIILCDTVLNEVQRVKGLASTDVMSKVTKILGRNITLSSTSNQEKIRAGSITTQYEICHSGDNKILALCESRNFILLTFDRMLLKACEWIGVIAFHPKNAGGI